MGADSPRIIIKGGTFTDVEGDYHHHDYSVHTTNIDSFNAIGNIIENVNNSCPQMIYRARNVRLTPRGQFANGRIATGFFSAVDDYNQTLIESVESVSPSNLLPETASVPQTQTLKLGGGSNSPLLSYALPSNSQFLPNTYAQARPMDALESASLLQYKMTQATDEPDIELPVDNGTGEVSMEDMHINGQSQRLVEGLDSECLALKDERVSQPTIANSLTGDSITNQAALYPGLHDLRQNIVNATSMTTNILHGTTTPIAGTSTSISAVGSTPAHGSSNTTKVDKGPKYITIQGNYSQVDRSVHELNINSHIVADNIVKDSFNERQEVIVYHSQRRKAKPRSEKTGPEAGT